VVGISGKNGKGGVCLLANPNQCGVNGSFGTLHMSSLPVLSPKETREIAGGELGRWEFP
jgi:hypothetical protein